MAQTGGDIARGTFRRFLIEAAVVFVAYYIAGKLGQATYEIRSSNLGPVWPAYGVALAAVLLFGPRVWPALAASTFLVAFQSDVPHIAAAGQAVAATLAALTGGALLRHAKFDRSMSRLYDALGLIVLGALVSAMVSASLGVAVLYATGVQAYSGIGPAWLIYWLGDSTGVLLITPLALTGANLLTLRPQGRIAELAALILFLAIMCLGIFGDLALIPVRLHVLAFAVLPFIIWAAIRFGVSGVALSTLLVATIATVATALGDGPFAQNTTFTNAVLLDAFFAVLSVSGLTLAAVIAERQRVEAEHEQLIREQAAVEERLHGAILLRESEEKLRLILDAAFEGIFGINLEFRCTFCNQACLRTLGYSSDKDLLGQDMHRMIHHSHADGSPLIVDACRIKTVVETGRGIHVDDEVLWKADGTSFPAEWWAYPQLQGPRVVGVVVGFRDITHRRRAEEKTAELHRELAHLSRVGMLNALTGALAHEFNQPLTAVRVNAEAALLLLATQPASLNEVREALNDIRNDNQRAGDVLQHMRALLKKDAPCYELIDINSTVGDVVKLIQSSAAGRSIVIEVDPASGARPVRGDRVQIQQVILNLLMNACDAVQENERSLRRVSLKTIVGLDGMVVEVRDCGAGLSDDAMARIFEPFYSTKHEGMGLGLSICRAITEAHGGTLEAMRNPDRGMTFSAAFSLWQPAAVTHDNPVVSQLRQDR